MRLTRLDELGARPSTYLARMRIEQLIDLPRLFAVIDADPALIGAGVVYIDAQYNIVNLRRFQAVCSVVPKRVVIQEVRHAVTPQQYADRVLDDPRESRVLAEVANAGLACAGAALGVVLLVVGGGIVTLPIGIAKLITFLGSAGVSAAVMQCGIGGMRILGEVANPEAIDALDRQEWYQLVTQLLDAISLLAVGGGSYSMIRYLQVRKNVTGSSWLELLRPLSRQQRKSLNDEVLRIKHPSLTNKQLKLSQRSGTKKKRLTAQEMNRATITLIGDALANVVSVAGSSRVQSLAVSLIESDPE
ncbi:Uncharacterised protein [Pseudomonas putida]|uniref:NAD synthetase n=1 Tax=Pseudomonas guariconensis TaxID=1288410 RepID=UPI001FA51C0C|nr:NAD synthetase [Pseudomonas guariconensis]CAB5551128.1 Uncharacterised protein [Pseudomonas putida]MEB3843601.1 NAD synthetase [Pseudomonas guariconensis]MEB3876469.1 NAD synthetase [Pseudomonas guariconensis]MEB3880730.1 NAD synthetase [Pseudomonas guariconensis]MEB3897534.1 NAD synthetase [Pseudomonas guariconensis]